MKKSSLGMKENKAALLSYLFGFVTGILILEMEKNNRFVRFHAYQSILISIALVLLTAVVGHVPMVDYVAASLLVPAVITLWILLMVKAYRHEWFKLPLIGKFAASQIGAKPL
jgi:uncharacterized membrane protein